MGDFIRSLLRSTSSHHRPWQLSIAVGLGLLCGLLPKLNLTFCLVVSICCVLPIHLPLAALVCLTCSLWTNALASTAGLVGHWSLTHPLLKEMWLTIDAVPWVPWLGLNNTVIHGSLLLGLAWLPLVYSLTKPISNRLSPLPERRRQILADKDFVQELRPVIARMGYKQKVERPVEVSVGDCAIDSVDEQTCQELEILLATCNGDEASETTAAQVAERAAQMAQFVDQLLTSYQSDAAVIVKHESSSANDLSQPRQHFSIAPPSPDSSGNIRSAKLNSTSTIARPVTKGAVPQSLSRSEGELSRHHLEHGSRDVVRHGEVLQRSGVRTTNEVQPAETLRYLLHHLKAIKDKV